NDRRGAGGDRRGLGGSLPRPRERFSGSKHLHLTLTAGVGNSGMSGGMEEAGGLARRWFHAQPRPLWVRSNEFRAWRLDWNRVTVRPLRAGSSKRAKPPPSTPMG